ncbi:hypothetical protein BGZ73_000545 [Actinomortierella ambigua]|nr:hypothetical protein BGZ73_000545 [Actinomortierella ambigua]
MTYADHNSSVNPHDTTAPAARFRSATSQGWSGPSTRSRVVTQGGIGLDTAISTIAPPATENVLAFPPPAVVPSSASENMPVGGLQWDLSALRLDTTSLLGRRMRTRTVMAPLTPVTPTYSSKDKISNISAHTASSVSDAGDQSDHPVGAKMSRSYSSSSKSPSQLRALTIPATYPYHGGHRHSRSVDGIKTPVSAVSVADDPLAHAMMPSKKPPLDEHGVHEAQTALVASKMPNHLERPVATTFESTTPVSPTFTDPVVAVGLPSSPIHGTVAPSSLAAMQRKDKAPVASPMVTVTFEAVSYAVHEDANKSR